ncbi:MAG: 3-deoxy-7-phosphoheptulonate synthase [Desulfarculaceae bacterium]|jgi:3-deoxy-7-phosphoheptulonate synthase
MLSAGMKNHSLAAAVPKAASCPEPILGKPRELLASRKSQPQDTVIQVAGTKIGGPDFIVIAGPCSVENPDQLFCTAKAVKKAGAAILRGGAYKPRTSPYSFQGLGERGLELLAWAREVTGLPIVTEVMDTADIPMVEQYTDIIQVGARNVQNFSLLRKLGQASKPVLLKRGLMTTIKEFLNCAEYILAAGNSQVILCERGIRTFETATRNTLDLSAVCVLKELSHLPVVVDPSHAVGNRRYVQPLARAAMAVGADGIMVEVHCSPAEALCDGDQSLTPEDFSCLMSELESLGRIRPLWRHS